MELSSMKNFEIVSAYVVDKLAGQGANSGAQPMDVGQIDNSEGEDEDFNATSSCVRVRSHVGSSHFLFKRARFTSVSGFVLSKCLQPSFVFSHLFSRHV